MMSKSTTMMAVLFSLSSAMVHDAMAPADHQLETTRQNAAHNAAMESLGAREVHIDEANELRKTAENARHADELARIAAARAFAVAAHLRAKDAIAADRKGIHDRMVAYEALPSANPAVVVGGPAHPAVPAGLAGAQAAMLARIADAARLEAERHAERLVELDTAHDTEIASHNYILRQFKEEVRTALELTRRNGDVAVAAHQASLHNLGERMQRHIREERERVAAQAIADGVAARRPRVNDRVAAAIRDAGGRD